MSETLTAIFLETYRGQVWNGCLFEITVILTDFICNLRDCPTNEANAAGYG